MPQKWNTWTHFLTSSTTILQELEKELKATTGLTVSEYDVLATVHNAKDHTLSMACLKATVIVTTSGLSRAVTRLVNRGTLTKTTDPDDKRALTLQLTPSGEQLATEAIALHDSVIERSFFQALSPQQLKDLGEITAHLHNHLNTTT